MFINFFALKGVISVSWLENVRFCCVVPPREQSKRCITRDMCSLSAFVQEPQARMMNDWTMLMLSHSVRDVIFVLHAQGFWFDTKKGSEAFASWRCTQWPPCIPNTDDTCTLCVTPRVCVTWVITWLLFLWFVMLTNASWSVAKTTTLCNRSHTWWLLRFQIFTQKWHSFQKWQIVLRLFLHSFVFHRLNFKDAASVFRLKEYKIAKIVQNSKRREPITLFETLTKRRRSGPLMSGEKHSTFLPRTMNDLASFVQEWSHVC